MRRRAFAILLLPIIVFVFMIGWIFYWMGKQQDKGSVPTLNKTTASNMHSEEENVELGLIEDLMEKEAET